MDSCIGGSHNGTSWEDLWGAHFEAEATQREPNMQVHLLRLEQARM